MAVTLHSIKERVGDISNFQGAEYETHALAELLATADKVILNMDGVHGVYRESCDNNKLLSRASRESCLFLDLGHVVRIYFGDDYFDIYLDTQISCERPAPLTELVEAAKKESELASQG